MVTYRRGEIGEGGQRANLVNKGGEQWLCAHSYPNVSLSCFEIQQNAFHATNDVFFNYLAATFGITDIHLPPPPFFVLYK